MSRAATLPGRALHVALAVWHGAALAKTNRVKLTGKLLGRFAVKVGAARRGLQLLERAGLVAVERPGRGRCPVVTLIDVDTPVAQQSGLSEAVES